MKYLNETCAQFYLSDILTSIKNADTICQKVKMDSLYSYIKINVIGKNTYFKTFLENITMIRNNLTNVTDDDWTKCVSSGAIAIDNDIEFMNVIIKLNKVLK